MDTKKNKMLKYLVTETVDLPELCLNLSVNPRIRGLERENELALASPACHFWLAWNKMENRPSCLSFSWRHIL